eukprot:1469967-Prymnesium_polylepis.4
MCARLQSVAQLPLHWIDRRMHEQRARTLVDFWRAFMRCEPPTHLFHAQGAQFSVSRRAIQSRPRAFYRTLLDELLHVDPVASYYLEVMWWYIFDARAARACVPLESTGCCGLHAHASVAGGSHTATVAQPQRASVTGQEPELEAATRELSGCCLEPTANKPNRNAETNYGFRTTHAAPSRTFLATSPRRGAATPRMEGGGLRGSCP